MAEKKPVRVFHGKKGQRSVDDRGPQAIIADLDTLCRMFDPLSTHKDGIQGGISTTNIRDGIFTDGKIGPRTVNDAITDTISDTGTFTQLLSWMARMIRTTTGEANWRTSPTKTFQQVTQDAESAVLTAGLAQTTAGQAVATANQANTQSTTATTTANQAVVTANTADQTASNAELTVADAMNELEGAIIRAEQAVIDARGAVGNTSIVFDVYIIVTSDNGDGTFTYRSGDSNFTGIITDQGHQRFELTQDYFVGGNKIEATINDTLTRSQASGGLQEVGNLGSISNIVELTHPVGDGTKVTFRYFHQISLGGMHGMMHNVGGSDALIGIGTALPSTTYAGQLFYRVV